jgi:hypothetical protein
MPGTSPQAATILRHPPAALAADVAALRLPLGAYREGRGAAGVRHIHGRVLHVDAAYSDGLEVAEAVGALQAEG